MGNRAVITCAPYAASNVGIYVHWNGGQESVQGFLDACKALRFRSPENDPSYAMARLVQVIGAFFEGGLSVGLGKVSEFGGLDNGVWIIGGDWQIQGNKQRSEFVETLTDPELEKAAEIAAMCVERINCVIPGEK